MPPPPSLDEYLTVKLAAEFLGVSPSTLRNWDRAGKLKPHRHPMNRYRLYRRTELEAVLRSAAEREREHG
jgi:MerR family transcriptional regulator, copper efflux regulator